MAAGSFGCMAIADALGYPLDSHDPEVLARGVFWTALPFQLVAYLMQLPLIHIFERDNISVP